MRMGIPVQPNEATRDSEAGLGRILSPWHASETASAKTCSLQVFTWERIFSREHNPNLTGSNPTGTKELSFYVL